MAISFNLDGTFSGFTGGVIVVKDGVSHKLDKIQLENGTVVWKKFEWKRIYRPRPHTRVWSGKAQYGFDEGEGYTVSGAGTAAGTYTSYATLKDGYAWDDTDDRSPWSTTFEIKHLAVSETSDVTAREEIIDGHPTAIFSYAMQPRLWGFVISLSRVGYQWRKYYPSAMDGIRTKSTMIAQNGTELEWARTTSAYYSFDGSKMTVYVPLGNTTPDAGDIITCTDLKYFGSFYGNVNVAEVPTATTGLKYNGKEQTGVMPTIGCGVSGDYAATNAGDYTATCILDDVHFWPNGKTILSEPTKTVDWSISKATWSSVKMRRTDGGNLGIIVYGSDVYNRRGQKFTGISYTIYWGTSTKAGVTLAAAGVSKGTTTNGKGHLPEATDSGNLYIDTGIPMSQTFTYDGKKRKLSDCYVRAEGIAHSATTNWEAFNFSIPQGEAVKV